MVTVVHGGRGVRDHVRMMIMMMIHDEFYKISIVSHSERVAKSRLTLKLIDVADGGVGEWKQKVFDELVVIDPSRIRVSENRGILSGVVEYIHAIERRMRSARQARDERERERLQVTVQAGRERNEPMQCVSLDHHR